MLSPDLSAVPQPGVMTAAPDTEPLVMGISAQLSGRHCVQGKESLKGIRLLVENLRGRGGIKTRGGKVFVPELMFYDDGSLPEKTRENTLRLLEKDRVDVLLGPYSSSLALACARTAAEAGRVVWNHGGSSEDIPGAGGARVVSAITGASSYFHGVVDMMGGFRDRPREIALLGLSGSGFAESVCEGARLRAESLGINAPTLYFQGGTKDFSRVISAAGKRGADCLLCCGGMEDDINLALWASENERDSFRVVATLAAAVNEFGNRLGRRSEGFVSTSQWEPALEAPVDFGPSAGEFSREFEKAHGYVPDYTAAQSCNMGLIVAKLAERTSSRNDGVLFEEALRSRFRTFYGDFRLDPRTLEQTGHRMLVTQWQDGEKRIIFPLEHAESGFTAGGVVEPMGFEPTTS